MKVFLRGHALRAEADGKGPIRFVAATEGRKADGLNLQMGTVELDRFRANPVILYGHQYFGRDSLPIGRAEDVFVDGDRLMEDIQFDLDDPFAAAVDRKVRAGFVNAVSIGFDVTNVDQQTGIPERWELLETSVVPVPLDPDALKDSERAGLASLRSYLLEQRDAILDERLPPPCPRCTGEPPPPPATPRLAAARRRLRLAGAR